MTDLLAAVFWFSATGLAYVYVGYPLLLLVMSRLAGRPVHVAPFEPTVSILIAAHNEVAHIGQTLANKLALDYPADKLEIIVVSDGSVDGTDAVVQEYGTRGVRLLRQEPRNGKTAALNAAVSVARGDVLVFSDANSIYDRAAVRYLVSDFADATVGYVTGRLRYLNPDGSMTGDGCSTYMRYENRIRAYESAIGSLVGVNGGIDAVRRRLYEPMHSDDLPDLVLPLRVAARGFRVVYEPRALVSETAHGNSMDEYRMRVRVSLRALWTLAEMPALLNVRKHGFYAVQVLSHKVLRYLAFLFMVLAFVSAGFLWPDGLVFRVAFVAQLTLAVLAFLGYIAERQGHPQRWLYVPYYFALVNLAALQAVIKFMRGERYRVWSPRLG